MRGDLIQATGVKQEVPISVLIGSNDSLRRFKLQQWQYSDGRNDLGERTYIFNTSGYALPTDAVFVVEADGTRHIKNYAILPGDDNFDFKSSDGLATLTSSWVQSNVDPGNIGRSVGIKFNDASKDAIVRRDYTQNDYVADATRLANTYHPLQGIQTLFNESDSILQSTGQMTSATVSGPISWAFSQDDGSKTVLSAPSSTSPTIRVTEYYSDTNLEPKSDTLVYTVADGETLSAIAPRYGMTWQELWKYNPQITDPGAMVIPPYSTVDRSRIMRPWPAAVSG